MHLNYPQKSNGMYILNKDDFDSIAASFLQEYCPDVLNTPQPLDVEHIINECLFIECKAVHLALDGGILGLMAFGDTDIPCYDMMYRPTKEHVAEGTMLIDTSLLGRDRLPRKRFTQMHEVSHWICHRSYHSGGKQVYDCRRSSPNPGYIACRSSNIEAFGRNSRKELKNDSDWEEWQADHLSAALLMPKNPFGEYARNCFRKHGIGNILIDGEYTANSIAAIEDISDFFLVSKTAAQIRLKQLGLQKSRSEYNRFFWSNFR